MNTIDWAALAPVLAPVFAPSGRLQVGINVGNPVLAGRRPQPATHADPSSLGLSDAADAETDAAAAAPAQGVSVDLARALAARLGLAIDWHVFDTAGKVVEAVKNGVDQSLGQSVERGIDDGASKPAGRIALDLVFLAIDPLRAQDLLYSPPYVLIEAFYLVRQDAPIQCNAEVDRPGARVVVAQGSAYDLFLSRQVQHAELVRCATSQEVVDVFLRQGHEAAAGVRAQLQADVQRCAAQGQALRLLPERFMAIEQAVALPRRDALNQAPAEAALHAFVEDMKASGFVAEALRRHRVGAAQVAPAGQAPLPGY